MDPLLYTYTIGGAIFVVGLVYGWKHGYIGLRGWPLLRLVGCLAVMGFFFALQAYLQYGTMTTADPVPYRGGAEDALQKDGKTRGTALDYGS